MQGTAKAAPRKRQLKQRTAVSVSPMSTSQLTAEAVLGLNEGRYRKACNDYAGDLVELVDIVREAVGARNGWKRILARCAPGTPLR